MSQAAPVRETRSRGAEDEAGQISWRGPVLIAVAMGAAHAIGLSSAGFYDNEGRFVEGARQMLVRSDWVTPYLNDVPILTKPPFTQWLTAIAFLVVGQNEWARVVALVASMLTVVGTSVLGMRLFDRRTGLLAGVVLATMLGFALEARTLRPDALLVASCTWALVLWHGAETGPASGRTWRLAGFWAVLGVGMLAKGLVPFVVVGPPVALWMVRRHGWGALAGLRPGLGLAVVALVVLPWHLAAALANPGFAWDYVVNQHVLFAFDKKEPRDSEGDTLVFFWLAMLFRTAPWGVAALLTLGRARRETSASDPAGAPALLVWTWVLGHVAAFSVVPSRLEHYTLPAHPALALLAAHALVLLGRGVLGGRAWWGVGTLGVVLAGLGVVLLVAGRELVSQAYWIPQAPRMLDLVPWAGIVLAVGGVCAVAAALRRAARAMTVALATVGGAMSAICAVALVIATPLFSWRPVAELIGRDVPPDAEIVFEAPIEYQLVGGLDFYLGRSVTMLEPAAGFVPPTYLEGRTDGMFMSRPALARRWTDDRPLVLVSDPLERRDEPSGIAPGPFTVLGRFGDRWVLGNPAVGR